MTTRTTATSHPHHDEGSTNTMASSSRRGRITTLRYYIKQMIKTSLLLYVLFIGTLFIYSFYTTYFINDENLHFDVRLQSITMNDPLHLDTFRTFTKRGSNTTFIIPIYGYIYYNTDLEFYYHQLFRTAEQGEEMTYMNELHHLVHLTYKLYLKLLFHCIQILFNIEYTLFKELEFFFLRFSAPKQLNIQLTLMNLTTRVIHSDEYGYFYHPIELDMEQYNTLYCNDNNTWIEYKVQVLDHIKTGHVLKNCDHIHTINITNDTSNTTTTNETITTPYYSIISDIDDSIKITNVTSGLRAMMRSTFDTFRVVPHMNDTFIKFHQNNPQVNFHYVSSSPYVLYNKLIQFLERHGFPMGSFHLRVSHLENYTFFTMLQSSKLSKPSTIREIIEHYPMRWFILLGDSAENDADIYGRIYQMYPNQIKRILIRCASRTMDQCVEKIESAIQLYGIPRQLVHYFSDHLSEQPILL